MRLTHSTVLLMACLLASASGCAGSITADRWPEYRVVGRVTDPAGVSVAGATVIVRSFWEPLCESTMTAGGPFTTNTAGRYRATFVNGMSEFHGCVDVTIEPPAGRRLLVATRRVTGVFRNADRGDSTVIDVQLAAMP